MQQINKWIFAGILLMTITSVYANDYTSTIPLQGLKYRWTLGFDIDNQIMHMQNDFTNIGYNYRHGMELYVAYRTKGPLGFEGGYHWTTDKAKNFSTVPGSSLFGATAVTGAQYQAKLRVEDSYLDMYWHYPIKNIVEAKFGIGVGFVRENMRFYNVPQPTSDPVALVLTYLTTDTTITARFNIGLQGMLTKQLGMRGLLEYQTTNSVKAVNLPGGNPTMFGNSYMILIGLFYNVTGYYD